MSVNKAGSLFLIAVLALAGIGVAYAGFTDTITVSGSVETGKVEFDIVEYSGTWVWKNINEHSKEVHNGAPVDVDGDGIKDDDPNGYYDDNGNVLDGWKLVSHSCAHEGDTDDVNFVFDNMFPCVWFEADFKFQIGTIPVFLTSTPDNAINWYLQEVNGQSEPWIYGIAGEADSPDIKVEILDEDDNVVWPAPAGTDGIVQLHPGVTYEWILTIHIPQNNAYMNCYAEGNLKLDIIQWSDDCDFTPNPDKDLILPDSMNAHIHHWGSDSYWDVTINSLTPAQPDGYYSSPIYETSVLKGWCCDEGTTIPNNVNRDFTVIYENRESYRPGHDENTPSGISPWDCVDYIINHDDFSENGVKEYNTNHVQHAIWYYINGGNYPSAYADAVALINDVNTTAVSWCNDHPELGDWVAVIIDPNDVEHTNQILIIEVDP